MEQMKAISTLRTLYVRWIGSGFAVTTAAADNVRRVIRQELDWNKQLPARCSAGCKAATHGDAIALGKARKALGL